MVEFDGRSALAAVAGVVRGRRISWHRPREESAVSCMT